MMTFKGFPSTKTKVVAVPVSFFQQLLPELQNPFEIKVILYSFWYLSQQEQNSQFIMLEDFVKDQAFMDGLPQNSQESLKKALTDAVAHNVFLVGEYQDKKLYFLNTPRGRAAVKGLELGSWSPEMLTRVPVEMGEERPTVFHLYEQNIGPLTPMMGEILQDAEATYPEDWIRDAIRIAVEKDVRNWRYVEAILKSWQKEGRSEKNQRDTQENRRKYIEGEYGDIIEH